MAQQFMMNKPTKEEEERSRQLVDWHRHSQPAGNFVLVSSRAALHLTRHRLYFFFKYSAVIEAPLHSGTSL